jgi:hypothetical protein
MARKFVLRSNGVARARAAALTPVRQINLSSTSFEEQSVEDVLIGSFSISNGIGNYIYTILNDVGNRLKITGDKLYVGSVSTVYASVQSVDLTVLAVSDSHAQAVSNSFTISIVELPVANPSVINVDSDAELTTAINNNAVAGNVTIKLDPNASYGANRSFANVNPILPITLQTDEAISTSIKAQLKSIVMQNTSNLVFRNIDHGDATANSGRCVSLTTTGAPGATLTNCTWENCDFYGSPIDPLMAQIPVGGPVITTRHGIHADGGGYFLNLKFTNCYFHDLEYGHRCQGYPGKGPEIIGCVFDKMFADAIQIGFYGPTPPYGIKVNWNIFTRAVGSLNDYGAGNGSHCDAFQMFTNQSSGPPIYDTEFVGNITYSGLARGDFQGLLLQANSTAGKQHGAKIAHNIRISPLGDDHVINIAGASGCYVFNNIGARYQPTVGSEVPTVAVVQVDSNPNFIDSSMAELFAIGGFPDGENNLRLAKTDGSYNSNYVGPFAAPTDTDNVNVLISRYARAASSVLAPLNGVVDYTTRTIDYTREPTWIAFRHLKSQVQNTSIESGWLRIIGGGPAQALTIADGEYKIADDRNGLNESAWSSSPATVDEGLFINIRHTTPSLPSKTTITTVTIGGDANKFKTTTAESVPYVAADNQGVAYSRMVPNNTENTIRKMIIAVRFDPTTLNYGCGIFASGGEQISLTYQSPKRWRFQLLNGSSCRNTASIAPGYGDQLHLIHIDATQSSGSLGLRWFVDGKEIKFHDSKVWNNATINSTTNLIMNNILNQLGLFDKGDGTLAAYSGKISMLYMDWGGPTYQLPDISDPLYHDKFLPDNIGATGAGPTGSQPKLCFYGAIGNADGSTANSWNATAGLLNRGSFSCAMIKQAGTYI